MAAPPRNEGSVAPKERINIVYKTETGGVQSEVELPLRLLVVGDFTGKPDTRPVEERKPISIDKNNFDEVLKGQQVGVTLNVENVLEDRKGTELKADLRFENMKDFEPESIARQVPELRKLLELREALTELKGPLSQNADFRKQLQKLLDDNPDGGSILDDLELGAQ